METEKERNFDRYATETPTKFDVLRWSWILGIMNSNDVAISQQFYFDEAPTHEEIFPLAKERRWRWDFDKGITLSVYSDNFTKEDCEIIRNHLRREYGIRFYENGFHDIPYFISKMSKK